MPWIAIGSTTRMPGRWWCFGASPGIDMPLRQPAVLGVKAASATTLMSPLFSAKNTSPLEANSTASWLYQSAEDDVLATRVHGQSGGVEARQG